MPPTPATPADPPAPDHAGASPWQIVRRAPRHTDGALTGTARRWLRALPPRRRALKLCQRFPRVANRVAWCWHDPALADQALDDLLVDRRGGRAGFPAPVVRELRMLREFNARRFTNGAAPAPWSLPGAALGLG